MNQVQKGFCRDREILTTLEQWKVMDALQVKSVLFNFAWGQRKAQERLFKLHQKGKVKRWKGEEGFQYSLDDKPGRAEHTYLLNWVRVWVEKLPQWEKVHYWQYEDDYGILRADAFCAIKNTITGKFRFLFIELDRTHSNAFDKAKKYNRMFKEGKYEGRWWVELTDRFPTVLVATTTESRKEKILQHIEKENENGLEFDVRLLCDLKKEVLGR